MGNFIGPEPVRSYAPLAVKDDFSGDGSTTTFDLSRDITPGGQNSLLLYVGTTIQEPGVDYTIGNDGSGNPRRITFTSAPASGSNNIFAIHRDRETGRFTPDDNSVGNGQLESTAITGFSNVTAASGDSLLISDVSDSGNLKKVTATSIAALASTDLVGDTSPQLGGDLDVNANDIVSAGNNNISLLPNGSGKVVMDGDGSSGGVSIDDGNIDIRTASGVVSKVKFYCENNNAHAQTLQAQPHSAASSAVLTLPVATGTLVGTGDTSSVSNTMLAGSIAASKLAGSIGNAKLSNSSISVSDGSSSTAIALGGTATFSGTANEVDVAESSGTITIGLPNDIVVAGNLTVNGTTTTINTTNLAVTDNLVELNQGLTGAASNDSGILIERGSTGNNAIMAWDESADGFILGTTTATASDTGNLSITVAPLAVSTISATELDMGDSEKIKLGAGNDLEIYHDGTNSIIDNNTGQLKINGDDIHFMNAADSETMLDMAVNGAVTLYYDDSAKLATTSAGATITGVLTSDGLDMGNSEKIRLGASQELEIYSDGTNSYITESGGSGNLRLQGQTVRLEKASDGEIMLEATNDAGVDIRYNGSTKLETTNTGVTITGTATATTFSGSGASLTSLPAGNLTGTLPAISGANLTNIPLGPSSATAVGALKEFAIYYKGSGGAAATQTISVGDEITPGTYDVSNMYLGVPQALTVNVPASGGTVNTMGWYRGFRASSDVTGQTRATETGTWRCIAQAVYTGGTTSGQNGITYHLSLAGLFQRVS